MLSDLEAAEWTAYNLHRDVINRDNTIAEMHAIIIQREEAIAVRDTIIEEQEESIMWRDAELDALPSSAPSLSILTPLPSPTPTSEEASASASEAEASCSICMEQFRLPWTGLCGHTFCFDCIDRATDACYATDHPDDEALADAYDAWHLAHKIMPSVDFISCPSCPMCRKTSVFHKVY